MLKHIESIRTYISLSSPTNSAQNAAIIFAAVLRVLCALRASDIQTERLDQQTPYVNYTYRGTAYRVSLPSAVLFTILYKWLTHRSGLKGLSVGVFRSNANHCLSSPSQKHRQINSTVKEREKKYMQELRLKKLAGGIQSC